MSLPSAAARRFARVRILLTLGKLAGLTVFLVLLVMVIEGWKP